MIVAIDYDGTIADTNRQKVKWIRARLGIDVAPWECNRTDCVPLIGIKAYEEMGREIYERESSLAAPEVPGALRAIRGLARRAKVHIVTARPPRNMNYSREWLQEKDVIDCLAGIVSSEGAAKSDICAALGARVLIDDDIRHLRDVEVEGLVRVYLQEGREKAPACGPGVVFCRSWEEVVQLVNGM